eukprot:COSAG04_NODE_8730_length_937_cov_4.483294_1_plen_311_part_11
MQLGTHSSHCDDRSSDLSSSFTQPNADTSPSLTWPLDSALKMAVHLCKMNASAGLSARPTMSSMMVTMTMRLMETAARVESHAAWLLDSGVIEAMDYACQNEFLVLGLSLSGTAAGAVVALVGRNEGGKTLSRSTVAAVVDGLALHFEPTHFYFDTIASKIVSIAQRVAIMTVADANKKIMLQHDKLLNTLVTGLLLDDDNPRRGQDGADALQEVCVGVLHELALYRPGASAMQSDKRTMDALRMLAEVGTKESRERAAGALFELQTERRNADMEDQPGSSAAPHIMMSYNWDHQDVILRVVAWLQAHGYL